MKRLFPILSILTALLLAYAFYQAWVVAPAQWGRHNEKRESYGHSLIVDPWGTIVGEQPDGDGVVVATLDGAAVDKRRTQMPCLHHAVLWK